MAIKIINKIVQKHKKPKYIAFADFETISISGVAYVFAVGLFYQNSYFEFYANTDNCLVSESKIILEQFIQKCLTFSKGTTIYFHNFSGFDGYFLMKHFIDFNLIVNVIIRDSKIFKIKYAHIQFLDSFLMLNDSLNNIAKRFLGKTKIEIDLVFTLTRLVSEKIKILEYLKQDIILLKDCFIIFINFIWNEYKINITKCITIPSLSFLIFRKIFYGNHLISVPDNTIYTYIKSSYFGGINEVLIPKGSNLKLYDINSLYSYSMRNFGMPIKSIGWKTKQDLCLLQNSFETFFGFASVKIFIPKTLTIGPLGKKVKGKLIFPVGTISGVFFPEEIKFAVQMGGQLLRVYSAVEFQKNIIFKDFVDHFYMRKRNSKGFEKYFYKLILNSLYGRFGMEKEIQKFTYINSKEQLNKFLICTKNMDILKNFNENYIIKYTYSKNPKTEEILKTWGSVGIKYLSFIKTMNFKLSQVNACVAISAAITAYSRIKMLKDIYLLQHYCNVYYIDTDSLVTDKPLPQILCGSELGKYKLEYDHCDGIFLTSKVYILKHKDSVQVLKIAFKGLTKDLVEKLTWEWFLSQYTNQTSVKFNLMNKMKKFFKFFEIYTNICMSYTTNFGMTKRIKVYNTQNQWINTKPFDNDLL